MWPHGAPDLETLTVSLHTYTGEQLEVLGSVSVDLHSLLGRNWLQKTQTGLAGDSPAPRDCLSY